MKRADSLDEEPEKRILGIDPWQRNQIIMILLAVGLVVFTMFFPAFVGNLIMDTSNTTEEVWNLVQNGTDEGLDTVLPMPGFNEENSVELELINQNENETAELLGDPNISAPVENLTEIIDINETVENISSEVTDNISLNITLNETEIVENITTNTTLNLTENLSVNLSANLTANLTINISINATNITQNLTQNLTLNLTNETLTQGKAEIGKPVKWTKIIKAIDEGNLTTSLPESAEQVRVTEDGADVEILAKTQKELQFSAERLKKYRIEYYTPGPEATEEIIGKKKRIVVSSEMHYRNITAYTEIEGASRDSIRLYWVRESGRENSQITEYEDQDGDGLIDKIYWQVPHLSNQTYEVEIVVLNVHSRPVLGGEWRIDFNTSGTANLTIEGIEGTEFAELWNDKENTTQDIDFLDVKCGNMTQKHKLWVQSGGEKYEYISLFNESRIVDKLIVENYYCTENGALVSKELTGGRHSLEFRFGDSTARAENYVSELNCTITAACSDTVVFRISSLLGNGHAELNNQSNYPNLVCCEERYGESLGTNCSAGDAVGLLKLSGQTNAHVEKYTEATYPFPVCINPGEYYNISCAYAADCSGYDTCVASISSTEQGRDTNLHVAGCDDPFVTKICCDTQETNHRPELPSVKLNATDHPYNESTADLNAWPQGLNDADGDAMIVVYNWIKDGTSLTHLNWPMKDNPRFSPDDQTVYGFSDPYLTGRLGGAAVGDSKEPEFNETGGKDGFGAYKFDGTDDYIYAPADFSSSTEGSIEMWISRKSKAGDQWAFNYYVTTADRIGIRAASADSNNIHVTMYDGAIEVADMDTDYTPGITGAWIHVVVVCNESNEAAVYINGERKATDSSAMCFDDVGSGTVLVGGYTEATPTSWKGRIDRVKVYNKELPEDQILRHYNGGNGRYNQTRSSMTNFSEVWKVDATPIDEHGLNGTTVTSNEVPIRYCISPYDGLSIIQDTILCPGVYNVDDDGEDGLISIDKDDVTLTCSETTIIGHETDPASKCIVLEGSRTGTRVHGPCNISNYYIGIYLNGEGVDSNTVEGLTINDGLGYSVGALIRDGDNNIFDNITIPQNYRKVRLDGTASGNNLTNFYMQPITLEQSDGAVYLVGAGVTNNRLENFDCGAGNGTNIIISDSPDNYLRNFTVNGTDGALGPAQFGMILNNISGTTFEDFRMNNFYGSAIHLNQPTNDGNVFRDFIITGDNITIRVEYSATGNYFENIYFDNTGYSDTCMSFSSSANNNNITNSTFKNCELGIFLGSTSGTGNLFAYNNFTGNDLHVRAGIPGNHFNTSVGGVAQGNWWDDIDLLKIYDMNLDGWGDMGIEYPYNSTVTDNVTSNVTDWGPATNKDGRIAAPLLVAPADESLITNSRNPVYFWFNSEPTLSENVCYDIEVDDDPAFGSPAVDVVCADETPGLQSSYYDASWLTFSTNYHWRVRANDSYNMSLWSTVWNFTVMPTVDVEMPVQEVDFGNMELNEYNDTTDDYPYPFVVKNEGNLKAKAKIWATVLWESSTIGYIGAGGKPSMPHHYYQYQIDEEEVDSYTWALDSAWVNMTNDSLNPILSVIENPWVNDSDEFQMEMAVLVPGDEPAGPKYTTITFILEQNETV
ncbi:LamG-like jellyroll fold domain-containing protein [Nanoarchaeota archaeon]